MPKPGVSTLEISATITSTSDNNDLKEFGEGVLILGMMDKNQIY
jgi:hypothetical protein